MFDTFEYVNELKAVGVDESQAAVQAKALTRIVDDKLATKQDLKGLELVLKHDIESTANALSSDMKELELTLKRDIEISADALKSDMKELELTFKRDIEVLRSEMKELELTLKRDIEISANALKSEIHSIKLDVVRWVVGTGVALLMSMFVMLRFFP
jgi:translation initiation factor IF-2